MSQEQRSEKLGSELVKRDLISREDLDAARKREKSSGIPWYRQLLQLKKVNFGPLEDMLRYEFHTQSDRSEHQALGNMLVKLQAITKEQLTEALALQKRNGRLLGDILLERGLVTRRVIGIALSKQYGIEFAELAETPSDKKALDTVPESIARRNNFIPVRLQGDRLTVLIANPQLAKGLGDVGIILGKRIHAMLTSVDSVREELAARYRGVTPRTRPGPAKGKAETEEKAPPSKRASKKTASTRAKRGNDKEGTAVAKKENTSKATAQKKDSNRFEEIARQASGMPVIKLVSTIIEGAANSGATDIHLDPQEPEMRVRYRIDGILHDVLSISPDIENAVISRIKIMADLDITETRHPQDGHISLEIGEVEFDIRVATMPTFLGERVVLRMLDQTAVLSGIKDLGLEKDDEG
ncbi:MAG: Flp pilus assembly complex ATPase component, partial [bacterium]|nr:Flp pilus assembly complex ATPase component [bacterium]